MTGTYITTSQRSAMRPLACQGLLVTDCFHQITALLKGLSTQHMALLAEPVHGNGHQGKESIDWYAHPSCTDGQLRPLSSLEPEERAQYLETIHALALDIQNKSADLLAHNDAQHALSAEMLRLALQHPSEEDIWLLGEQPIVVNWGFTSGTVGAQPEDLVRAVAAPLPQKASPTQHIGATTASTVAASQAHSPRVFSGCLLWLLPLLLLLLFLFLLLGAFGFLPFALPLPSACVPENPHIVPITEEVKKEHDYKKLIAEKQQLLLARAALCPPDPTQQVVARRPLTAPLFAPTKEPETQVVPKRPWESPLSTPAIEQGIESKDERPRRESNDLDIPKDAINKNDMSFLEGCWVSDRGLVNSRTGKPITVEYCFNKKGRGSRIIREANGRICKGSVTTSFGANGELFMTAPEARCPRGTAYVGQRVRCTRNDARTICRGRENDSDTRWDAKFRRK